LQVKRREAKETGIFNYQHGLSGIVRVEAEVGRFDPQLSRSSGRTSSIFTAKTAPPRRGRTKSTSSGIGERSGESRGGSAPSGARCKSLCMERHASQ
jgi:hypothetical protein